MNEDNTYLDILQSSSKEDWITVIRNEILNANQTTRVNLAYVLNELDTLPEETPLDFRLITEYAERIRSAADRITVLVNTMTALHDQILTEEASQREER